MDCNQVALNLQLYVDEELSGEAKEQIRQHLALCPECERCCQMELLLKQVLKEKIAYRVINSQMVEDVRHHVLGAIA